MKRQLWTLCLVVPVAFTIGCQKQVANPSATADNAANRTVELLTGNGAPSGAHYNLNIIGVPKGKTADMTGDNGRRIFVNLDGNSKIFLSNADLTDGTFKVLDANGTDANGASFQLPSPDADNDGTTSYSVWARALGKPGGSSVMTTCATEVGTGETICSTESLMSLREKGGSKFENVSRQLLYIYADLDGDGVDERYPLFDDTLQDYYWNYDNDGLKLLQLRFYDIPTNVN